METAYIVLLVLAVIYIPIWFWVWRNPEKAERYHLCKYGPCIMIRTQLGMKTMDRLARYPRFWSAFGFFSKAVSAVLFLMMMYMLVIALMAVPSRIASGSSIGIEYALAIPGFNPILPLSYGVVALLIAMVVHELGHGIQARANGARVDSSGLLYGVVPLGAFVEPNEEDMSKKSRKAQLDMYTAGISVNTVVAVLSIVILMGACGTITSNYGDDAGVYRVDAGSPALEAGVPASAIITGFTEAGSGEYSDAVATADGKQISVDLLGGEGPDSGLDPTRFYYIHYDYKGQSLTTSEPVQMGVYIRTLASGAPADSAGIQIGTFLCGFVNPDGSRTMVSSVSEFLNYFSSRNPGDSITVLIADVAEYGSTVAVTEKQVTLSERNGRAYIGMSVSTGGMTFTTPDILLNTASNPFYGADGAYSYVTSFFSFLSGPFNGADPIPDDVKWWYDTPGGDVFWIILSLLYWVFWLDILLAISNALPAYPFDGGFIFAGGLNWLCEKVGIKDEERRNRLSGSISNCVSSVVLFVFIIVILSFMM